MTDSGTVLKGLADLVMSCAPNKFKVDISESNESISYGQYQIRTNFLGSEDGFYPNDLISLRKVGHLLQLDSEIAGKKIYEGKFFNFYSCDHLYGKGYIENVEKLSLLYLAGLSELEKSYPQEIGAYRRTWKKAVKALNRNKITNALRIDGIISTTLKRMREFVAFDVFYQKGYNPVEANFGLLRFVPKIAAVEADNESDLTLPVENRPKKFKDCADYQECCPFWGCRYNTALDLNKTEIINHGRRYVRERITIYHPDASDWREYSVCSLNFVENHLTLETVGEIFGFTRERIRQIEEDSLKLLGSNNDRRDYF